MYKWIKIIAAIVSIFFGYFTWSISPQKSNQSSTLLISRSMICQRSHLAIAPLNKSGILRSEVGSFFEKT